ncbi:protealysin inhibitor emfourin [Microbacterium esteraromaticum]|uniref:protealysin inhibitor emfourin n=1 Tax=Microbacterium esteraromaticum TaxID=57043 RepID=UPI0021BDE52A|nr:protealysin inhibitor emfourin [Microbacterium esteraromaticum]
MHEREIPSEGTDSRSDAELNHIVVAVVRTGGLAGMRRRWRAEPGPEQTPRWLALVEQCPWDEPVRDDQPGADRYVWSIHARVQEQQREQQLEQVVPDARLQGPWRELVDAVRDANDPEEHPPAV